jgi:hypothetical protein
MYPAFKLLRSPSFLPLGATYSPGWALASSKTSLEASESEKVSDAQWNLDTKCSETPDDDPLGSKHVMKWKLNG